MPTAPTFNFILVTLNLISLTAAAQLNANCEVAGVWMPYFPKCNTNNYVLEFEDNFEGDRVDTSKWYIWEGYTLTDANQDCYRPENSVVEDGVYKAYARKETIVNRAIPWEPDSVIVRDGNINLRTFNYTSAEILSKRTFYYGKYEARIKFPNVKGIWPAFWMFGGGLKGDGWDEIDVYDGYRGTDHFVSSTGHDFDEVHKSNGCSKILENYADFSQWHILILEFEPDKLVWKVDGITARTLYRFLTATGNPVECGEDLGAGTYFQSKAFPVNSMNVIFGTGVGTSKGPSVEPDASSTFPNIVEVDYFRYYKRSDTPTSYIHVFPNPTTNNFAVNIDDDYSEDLKLRIINFFGQKIYESDVLGKSTAIDCSQFAKGIYFVIFSDTLGHIVQTQKIYIE